MAIVGDRIVTPISGWTRVESNNTIIIKTGSWSTENGMYNSGDSSIYTSSTGKIVNFTFIGSKIIILGGNYPDRTTATKVFIDGVELGTINQDSLALTRTVSFIAEGLTYGRHTVEIYKTDSKVFMFDSIDIDYNGAVGPANIGEQLLNPEVGWRRYDDTCIPMKTNGTIMKEVTTGFYNGSEIYFSKIGEYIKFKFYGTKIRIISDRNINRPLNNSKIIIDGIEYISSTNGNLSGQILSFEKLNLENKIHEVTLTAVVEGYVSLDAIDIDATGYLIHPTLQEKPNLETMEIGDIISCKYTAPTSGKVGYFSELGTCTSDYINPQTSSATPDGKFYFIKVDEDKFIADRNVQHSIAWSELNNNDLIDGRYDCNGIVLNGTSSYISIPIANIKYTNYLAYRIRIYRSTWNLTSTSKIISCAENGGFFLQATTNGSTSLGFCIGTSTYTTIDLMCDKSYSGVREFNISYDGTKLSFKVTDMSTGISVSGEAIKSGDVVYGNTSHMVIGAEPSTGVTIASPPDYLAGTVLEVVGRNSNTGFIENSYDLSSSDIFLNLNPKNYGSSVIYDTSKTKLICTVYNSTITRNPDSNIITIPTGGVAYNEFISEVPIMSNYENELCKITVSSEYDATFNGWKMFDNTNINENDCWASQNFLPCPHYVIIDFKNNPKIINLISITNRNFTDVGAPENISIYVSNDGDNYINLCNYKNTSNAQNYNWFVPFNNIEKYRYYKIQILSGYKSTWVCIGMIKLYNRNASSNNSSLTHKNQGGWPITNDWDTYIWKGNLNGKISPSDDLIWNYRNACSSTKEKTINSMVDISSATVSCPTNATLIIQRGYIDQFINDTSAKRCDVITSLLADKYRGFRPILITGGDN